jgi:hypothetical protein
MVTTVAYIALESVDELVQATHATVKYWLDIHTDRDAWARNMTLDEGCKYAFEMNPTMSNNYWSWSWKDAALEIWCQNNNGLFRECAECHVMYEYGCKNCCNRDDDDDNVPSSEALQAWLSDNEDDEIIACMIDEYTLEEALLTKGFVSFRDTMYTITCVIEDNCRTLLDRIENAETPDDQLVAVLAAFHLEHHTGNVLEDYGSQHGIDYEDVKRVCEEGLNVLFDSERITSFLLGDPVYI